MSKVSRKEVEHSNRYKKRPSNFLDWKNTAAKANKNAGLPYVTPRGIPKAGVPAPSGNKACGPGCTKPYCLLDGQRQAALHDDFYSSGSHETQTAVLMSLTRKEYPNDVRTLGPSRRSATYKYTLPDDQGIMQPVCRLTLQNVLGVTEDRIRSIQHRISSGSLRVTDRRGVHENRPMAVSQAVRDGIVAHIESFPSEISHYSRNSANPERRYLEKDLTVQKMFNLYNAVVGPEADGRFWLYSQEFRKTGLVIGPPRSDTCGKCDTLYIQMCAANSPQEVDRLDLESILHHSISDAGYASLKEDVQRNISDPTTEVFTFDLQQVLYAPLLTNGEYFYKRKYSCFNFAITSPKHDNTSKYYFWHESVAKRGAEEISSCIFRMIEASYQPLLPGQHRNLITYSDRCTGQNCNWSIVCMLRVVVARGYFTTVTHKFMSTGHSFLPCDREFATIERLKRTANVSVPSDWVRIIRNAKASNTVTEMDQQHFLSFDAVKNAYRQPTTLKVTQVMAIRLTSAVPGKIFTKISHEPDTNWDEHFADPRFVTGGQHYNLPRKYQNPLPISQEKRIDLHGMCEYLMPIHRGFYQNL